MFFLYILNLLVKMFYLTAPDSTVPLSTEQLNVAIQDLETALGISEIKIDHFVLSLPHQSFDENGLDETEVVNFSKSVQDSVLPVWAKLSELRQSGRIGRLGVAEFGKQELEILKTAAEAQGLAVPEINQVNLQDCCVLPKDLINYSKEQKVELLTHGDATGKRERENCVKGRGFEGTLHFFLLSLLCRCIQQSVS